MQIVKDENRFGSFSVNNLFVSEYMPGLSGDAVKLYLYLCYLYENRQDTTRSAIIKTLHFSEDTLKNAVGELRSRGLISTENKKITLADLGARKQSSETGIRPVTELRLPGENTPELTEAIKSINNTYFGGKMSIRWYDLIRRWQEDFDPEVLVLLFAHCEKYSSGALRLQYVEKVAESWHAAGIRTAKGLSVKLDEEDRLARFRDFLRQKMNRTAPFMDSDVSVMRKWLFTYHYGEEVLSVLLERTDFSNPTIRFFDRIVTEWHEAGLKSADEIRSYEEEKKKKAAEKRSGGKDTKPSARSRSEGKNGLRGNFEQREYTDDFFESLVSGSADGKGGKDGKNKGE